MRHPARLLAVLLVALGASLAAPPALAQSVVSVEPEAPTVGEPVYVTFSEPVDSVTVVYRPGAISAVSETFTPGSAAFEFTPDRAGVVSVAAGKASQNLSVRFRSAPLAGLLVMVLAGLVLFGGAAVSMRALLSDGHRIEVDPALRPDT
ncbi:hypothetical protein RQM47_08645 [Rubrivirga sp. S365]|uniref:hypothetical protein n=1 Tax=Rubrivirga sp. S365 TaxID=3076080 RepID=UPI0028C566E7|nr:hypothetical protein [Rubrivirga sp. S365]MDT7856705.1 hypothetical protein [Rubrivirga sp. S365]